MKTNKKNADIIEVFVKKKFGIKLNEEDELLYSSLDYDVIEALSSLINSVSFVYDIEDIVNNIEICDSFTVEDKNKIESEIKEQKRLIKKN